MFSLLTSQSHTLLHPIPKPRPRTSFSICPTRLSCFSAGVPTSTVCSVAASLLSKWVFKSAPQSSLFFAATRATPLTVVAAGMAKWLDIYSGVLMLRVLLSWFPNIPWDRQPLSAIRDLCDPYLNLFRNVIPPLFKSLDVSPLLAFAILGILSSLLTSGAAAA